MRHKKEITKVRKEKNYVKYLRRGKVEDMET